MITRRLLIALLVTIGLPVLLLAQSGTTMQHEHGTAQTQAGKQPPAGAQQQHMMQMQ